jgi:hypothetical protein
LRYYKANKKQKTLILGEFCQVCGYSRKHAIRALSEDLGVVPKRPGAKRTYGADVDHHLRVLREVMGRICSKKMKAAMPLWLPFYRDADDHIKEQLRKKQTRIKFYKSISA